MVNDEQDLQELEHFSIWKLVQYFVREQTNETTVSVSLFNSKTCFRVDPSDSWTLYTVQPSRRELKTFLKERKWNRKPMLWLWYWFWDWHWYFSYRFWHLLVFGFSGWTVAVLFCRYSEQVVDTICLYRIVHTKMKICWRFTYPSECVYIYIYIYIYIYLLTRVSDIVIYLGKSWPNG